MKTLYRLAHRLMLGRPSQGAVLEEVKALVQDAFPLIRGTITLRSAEEILNVEISRHISGLVEHELGRRIQESNATRVLG